MHILHIQTAIHIRGIWRKKMRSYIVQSIILTGLALYWILNRKKHSSFIFVMTLVTICVSELIVGLNIYKYILVYTNFESLSQNIITRFGVIENVVSTLLILSMLSIGVGILREKKNIGIEGKPRTKKKIIKILISILIACFSIYLFFVPSNSFDKLQVNSNEINNNRIFNIAGNTEENIEYAMQVLYDLDTSYTTEDVNDWINTLKESDIIQLSILDKNLSAYSVSKGSSMFRKYIDPIITDRIYFDYQYKRYFKVPEVGGYDVIALDYFVVEDRELHHYYSVLFYGNAERGPALFDKTYHEEVVYIYTTKSFLKLQNSGYLTFFDWKEFEYIYEFKGEDSVY